MRISGLALLAAIAVGGCVAETGAEDELLVDDVVDPGELGAADAVSGDSFFTVRNDFRRCVYPLCGGYWIAMVNASRTRCADGRYAAECYVAEIDLGGLGLSDDERAAADGELRSGRVLVRGARERRTIGSYTVQALVASEAWVAPGDFVAEGPYVHVVDNGIRCITSPCNSLDEQKLNSSLAATIAEVDFTVSGASDEQIALAQGALGEDGVIVAGYRYYVRGPAGRAKARTATAFWTRVVHRDAGCYVGGCSSQVCSDRPDVITTCEWQPHYACYATATCERQADGSCGWTETPELDACLAGSI